MSATAQELRDEFGNFGEHPEHPVADWQHEVQNGDTRRGYWEWVESNLEADAGLAPAGWVPSL